MTLLSQWQSEVEQHAPFLKVVTLHNTEDSSREAVASADIVIASTWLMQHSDGGRSHKAGAALRTIRRIHWHRILVDESHYNQSGHKIKNTLASLSATHRFCVTGTPIGHS